MVTTSSVATTATITAGSRGDVSNNNGSTNRPASNANATPVTRPTAARAVFDRG